MIGHHHTSTVAWPLTLWLLALWPKVDVLTWGNFLISAAMIFIVYCISAYILNRVVKNAKVIMNVNLKLNMYATMPELMRSGDFSVFKAQCSCLNSFENSNAQVSCRLSAMVILSSVLLITLFCSWNPISCWFLFVFFF